MRHAVFQVMRHAAGTGDHMEIEEPKHPDLVLENDGKWMPEEQIEKILELKHKLC